jgi:cytidylate kinase
MLTIPVITIDGPSGTGKGTIAGMLSRKLGWHFLDSGALYRLVGVGAERKKINYININEIVDFTQAMDVHFSRQFEGSIELNGEEISALIRDESAGSKASLVGAIPEVRQALIKRQLAFRQAPGLIADGRDMGTVVFPDAICKFFLTANPEERVRRRHKQLINKGLSVNLSALLQDIKERDKRDLQRSISPLIPAKDAIVIDTSVLSIDQVLEKVFQMSQQALLS